MPFCNCVNELLIAPVLFQTLFDFGVRGAGALEIALVHDHDVGQIEHDDLLQLQPAAVIGIHHQHGKIDNSIFLERHRLLAGADRLDDDVIEFRFREQREAIMRRRRKSAGLPTRGHAAHEDTIVLRVDHGGAIAQQCAFANNARIMRQNRDSPLWILIQETQYQFIDQRRFSRAAWPGETDDL